MTAVRRKNKAEALDLNKVEIQMEIDTGASLSIVNEKTWLEIGDIQDIQGTLKTCTGEHVQNIRESKVQIQYK